MLCFSDTETPSVFSLKIPLFTSNTPQMKSGQPSTSRIKSGQPSTSQTKSGQPNTSQTKSEQSNPMPTGPTAYWGGNSPPTDCTTTTDTTNPFALTAEDADEMLEALLQATPSTAPTPAVVSPDIDDDLKEVLGMDIGGFFNCEQLRVF